MLSALGVPVARLWEEQNKIKAKKRMLNLISTELVNKAKNVFIHQGPIRN